MAITEADLEECASEPIHLIGAVRPTGCIFAVTGPELRVVSASRNVRELLDRDVDDVLGRPLRELVAKRCGAELAADVEALGAAPSRLLRRYEWSPGRVAATFLHREIETQRVILEVGLAPDPVSELTDRFHAQIDVHDFDAAADLSRLMDLTARRIRNLTGYDRVMVYRFQDDGSGHVAAEAKRADLVSFLGLHYPAADIPEQARRLFVLNRVRVIEDIDYTAEPVVGEPLDLSGSMYRAVSPIHLRYLKNMGVRSSLAISLVRGDALWGLVACHHETPRAVPPSLVSLTHLLSQMLSVLAERQERIEQTEIASRCRRRMQAVVEGLTPGEGLFSTLSEQLDALMAVPSASGFALVEGRQIRTTGTVPPEALIASIASWLTSERRPLFWTRSLSRDYPPAASHRDSAAGLAALRLDPAGTSWALWFRRESVATVTWAGDPDEELTRGPDGRLMPRGSFEAWRAETRGKSDAWDEGELAALAPLKHLAAQSMQVPLAAATHLLGAATDPVIILDRAGTIVDWNAALDLHLPSRFARQAPIDEGLELPAAVPTTQLLDAALRGDVWVGEARVRDESERVFEAALVPVAAGEEAPEQVALVLRDVSERKQLEAQLQHAQRMEAIGQLTGGLAHNFNNLLAVMMGSADLALQEVGPDHPAAQDIEAILNTCDDAAKIVRDLMAFARREPVSESHADAVRCVRKTARLLRRTLPSRIALRLEVPDDDVLLVGVGAHQLEQVVMNLAINARDAIGEEGQITLRVFTTYLDGERARTRSLVAGTYVTLEVIDTGSGIPESLTDRIFDPFFTTKSETGGTGLGLSSCYGIASQHGGCITVRSAEGRGSVFSVMLPVPDSEPAGRGGDVTATHPGDRLLVVDDEPQVRGMIARLLRRDGYEVLEAEDGFEALERFESGETIDAMITDQVMPGMSGVELAARVREQRPELPILLVSGHTFEWPRAELRLPLLRKPFDASQLRRALAELESGVVESGE